MFRDPSTREGILYGTLLAFGLSLIGLGVHSLLRSPDEIAKVTGLVSVSQASSNP
jgi:hypothetical protein